MESRRKTAPRFSGLIRRRAPSPEAQPDHDDSAPSKSAPGKKSWAAPWGFVSKHIQKSMSRTATHFCDFDDDSDDGGTEEEKEKAEDKPQVPLKSCLRKRESSSSRVSFNHINNGGDGIHPKRGVDFGNDACQGALACRIRNQEHNRLSHHPNY